MDPITQGAVGAAVAVVASRRPQHVQAAVIGALAGMAPDLDVLIRSSDDPLLTLEYHRQFTHSVFFIPILGSLCALLIFVTAGRRWQLNWRHCLLWSLLGCATHGLLDSCTSYGTQLLWPFSGQRFAWDIISVVDPLFSLPLLTALLLATFTKHGYWQYIAIGWMLIYLGIGGLQQHRATTLGHQLAAERGHQPLRLQAKPSFANLAVWKIIYETDSTIYVAAIKPGLGTTRHWPGEQIPKPDINQAYPWLSPDAQQRRDITRFNEFSADYIAIDPSNPLRLFDARYAMLPHRIEPMWGIVLSPNNDPDQHARYFTQRQNSSAALQTLMAMIFE